jgi:hypothetical protein
VIKQTFHRLCVWGFGLGFSLCWTNAWAEMPVVTESSDAETKTIGTPVPLPSGWDACTPRRIKIAYINGLPVWQRAFLSPYRNLEYMRYRRCTKALMPETQRFMEEQYPLPYTPIDPRRSVSPSLQTTPPTTDPQ